MELQYHRVVLTVEAKKNLRRIKKRYGLKTYGAIKDLILELEFEPDKKGEPLTGKLRGLHSMHYSRFRIIYKIRANVSEVAVVTAGHHASGSRQDVYAAIERMVESGELDLEDIEPDD